MDLCIAHGGDVSQPSGGTDRVTALASGLQSRGIDVTLVVPDPAATMPDRLDAVTVESVSPSWLGVTNAITRGLAVSKHARDIAEETGAILQLEHSTLAGVGTLRGCEEFVLDMHDIAYPRFEHVDTPAAPVLKHGIKWLEQRAVDRASHTVVVSEYMNEMLQRNWGVSADRIDVLPNGYFPDRIAPHMDTEPEPGRVCFLGTLHPKVDVGAFAELAELSSVSELIIIGDGARRDDVADLERTHESVRATGRLPDEEAFGLLASGEVVVNPQTESDLQRSSSPVKLFYYAALGKPMVVTSGPPIVEELERAEAACVAASRGGFVDAVDGLLADSAARNELAGNTREKAREFNWDRRASYLASLYEEGDLA